MTLKVQVVSAERQVWSGEARMVVARTTEGEIGILTGHEPTLAVLGAGEVRVDAESGSGVTATVDGGFLSVEHDTVLVVAERVDVDGSDSAGSGAGERALTLTLAAESVAAAIVAVTALLALAVVVFAVRRRSLTRERGAFECSVRQGGHWSLGVARFDHQEITWWRVFSFALRPSRVWGRADLAVLERRAPSTAEAVTLGGRSVVVRCDHAGLPVDLSMSLDAYTGFASWLESAPPGPPASLS